VENFSIITNRRVLEVFQLIFLWVLPGAFSLLVAWGSLRALGSQSYDFLETAVLCAGVFMPLYYSVGSVIANKLAPRGKLEIPICLLATQALLLLID
jgi:hypothetical protein